MKQLSKFEIAAIKRTAQSVSMLITKRNKLQTQLEELNKDLAEVNDTIATFEQPVKAMTDGYTSEDIFKKKVTKYTDKKGKEQTKVEWVFKYPDTILPVKEGTVTSAEKFYDASPEATPDAVYSEVNYSINDNTSNTTDEWK